MCFKFISTKKQREIKDNQGTAWKVKFPIGFLLTPWFFNFNDLFSKNLNEFCLCHYFINFRFSICNSFVFLLMLGDVCCLS